jgi:putative FmdB family regulatory protein
VPTYEYACTTCGHRLEVTQKFTDDPLTECPDCGGQLRKVYAPVGIVLKGSGFYKTDSRAAAGSNGSSKKATESESSAKDSSSDDTTKSNSDQSKSESSSQSKDSAPAASSTS